MQRVKLNITIKWCIIPSDKVISLFSCMPKQKHTQKNKQLWKRSRAWSENPKWALQCKILEYIIEEWKVHSNFFFSFTTDDYMKNEMERNNN